ncbi:helix-turn-helix domain-containing protein [Williamsia sterculiae]|uniref:Helix-turn-helix domain-containing protein n=1 Tax=Williamsia sterculiae TaxID=1344003 RepID=A0A1N7EDL9_9NOCA|nr:helix-turn-helix transcriptional regulator [Williamsia sterculiae]SIR86170.1 Helix-turn-helix domain-containing protein [Williamsia sterculiae]
MAQLLREALGSSLRRVRNDQGRTLREVSTSARVSLGYLSEVERGQKEASSELVAAICDALDVEIADVMLDVGNTLRPMEPRVVPGHVAQARIAPSRVAPSRIAPSRIAEDTKVVIPAPASLAAV